MQAERDILRLAESTLRRLTQELADPFESGDPLIEALEDAADAIADAMDELAVLDG